MSQEKTFAVLEPLVMAISARALFDMEKENAVFEEYGLKAYREYQSDNENQVLSRGSAFHLVSGLLQFNEMVKDGEEKLVKVIIMSNNSPDLSLRIFKSIEHYDLDINQAVFSSGAPLHSYFSSFNVDLFLSRSDAEVSAAINNGIAAAVLYSPPQGFSPHKDEVRIAFDGDAVLFSEEAEKIKGCQSDNIIKKLGYKNKSELSENEATTMPPRFLTNRSIQNMFTDSLKKSYFQKNQNYVKMSK